jgi:DNA-binding transcriptional ArsR family regulator
LTDSLVKTKMFVVDDVFAVLGAKRRREILGLVWRCETSAGDIHRALSDLTFGAVSQHLAVLERAGLVSARREGRHRLYAARREGLLPLRDWLDSMWEGALVSLKALAEAEEAVSGKKARGRRRRR